MDLRKLILTENACYKKGRKHKVQGIMVHSTGANNPKLSRYVGPDDGDLGANPYGNHWNTYKPSGISVCVHGFIGKLKNGDIATYQTLPWDMVGWHSGNGYKGGAYSANNTGYIGFEICEDDLTDGEYFKKVYKEAVELTAYLCLKYGIEVNDTTVICHSEGNDMGIASNHGDVMHWFPRFGKSMNSFRQDVIEEMEEQSMVRYERLGDIPNGWGAQDMVRELMDSEVINGDGSDLAGNNDVIDISNDMLRMLAFNYRGGCYDKALTSHGFPPQVS